MERDTNRQSLEREAEVLRSLGRCCRNSNLNAEAGDFFERSGDIFKKIYEREDYRETEEDYRKRDYDNVILSYRLAEEAYDSVKERKKAGMVYRKAMEFRYRNPEYLGILERFWLFVRRYISNYGESPGRFLAWVLATVTFFALVYTPSDQWRSPWTLLWLMPIGVSIAAALSTLAFKRLKRLRRGFVLAVMGIAIGSAIAFSLSFLVKVDECDVFDDCPEERFYGPIRGFYLSFATFTTLGFGDVAPLNNWGAVFVSLEVLFGYVMFGILLTILARKILR